MGQVLAFTKAVSDQRMNEAVMNASLTRMAYCSEAKDFKKIMNELTPGGAKKNVPNVSSVPSDWITKE